MTHRSAAVLAFPLAFTFALAIPAVALADVPPADGGSGGSASTSAVLDADCTVAAQTMAGHTCQQCQVQGSSDSSCQDELGSDYNYVCKYSATVEVWCDGPAQTTFPDPSCALRAAPAPQSSGPVAALLGVALAALALRRRS